MVRAGVTALCLVALALTGCATDVTLPAIPSPRPADTQVVTPHLALPPDDPRAGRTILREESAASASFPLKPSVLVGSIVTVKVYCASVTKLRITFGAVPLAATCSPGNRGVTAIFDLRDATSVAVSLKPEVDYWVTVAVQP